MAFSVETVGKLFAAGRNYASLIVGFVGGVGVISASQSKGLTDSFDEIFNGLSMVVHGATSAWQILVVAFPIIGIVMAQFAARSARLDSQAKAVKAAVVDANTPVPPEVKATIIETAKEAIKT